MLRKTNRKAILVMTIIALPILAYLAMHASALLLDPEGPVGLMGGVLMAVFIVVGLGVPYWMLKLLAKKEHVDNPAEKELHLDDLPKDKDQVLDEESKNPL